MNFSQEPEHSDKPHLVGAQPWNAESDIVELAQHSFAPNELVYNRNHSPIRALNAVTLSVKVDGLIKHERVEVVAALQCAGNRRKTMQDRDHKGVEGLLWRGGTIANCNLHLCFASHVVPCQHDDWFGGSISLEKALDEEGDALLAIRLALDMAAEPVTPACMKMNGPPLSPDHGFPFRVVVPGYTGAGRVKWVDQITVAGRGSENFYQKKDYKVLPAKWSRVAALQANPLNSAIASVKTVPPGMLGLKGYAVRGLTGQVRKTEVSTDEGITWQPATITYQESCWSWSSWEAMVDVPPRARGKVWCRAIDTRGTTQHPDWNLRGVAYAAIGGKTVNV
ncbi:molybdopterin binding oxidoreductase [Daedalea quercina L-15889]|uniref:Molybdopterin binding oxidoreductase n=1 Tax=Daedalea quercina L-15889 TaxID=1314783 RepID=A0A165T7G0_9APHY|nr:molybdopterin binding oxidoreductase [Daedalea quercina L-15889]